MIISMKIALFLLIVLFIVPVIAIADDAIFLPIINKDDFSCWFCPKPDYLLTALPAGIINFTEEDTLWTANYSQTSDGYITAFKVNESQYCVNGAGGNSSWNESLADSLYYPLNTNPSGYLTGFNEVDPFWSANYSSVAFLANQSDWSVNSSNISNYCTNVLDGSYCYNESYNPFETPKTCSQIWGFSCSGTLDDAYLGCNGTKYDPWSFGVDVQEIYINASSFFVGEGVITVTCKFQEFAGFNSYEYIWYNNDSSSNANWIKIWNNSYNVNGPNNRTVAFKLNSTEGTHIIRCIMSYNAETTGNCSTSGDAYDNDDVNFTVTEDASNITYEVCINSIQNITVNNSIYFNGYPSSYFYPYSNPFNFTNDTTWQYNQTIPAMDYCDATFINLANESNLNVNSSVYWDNMDSFPILYEANISDLQSYILQSSEGDLNVNSSGYCSYIDNQTERDLFLNTTNDTYDAFVTANVSSIANNSYYLNGKSPSYFWNHTGNIPLNNITNPTNCTAGNLVQGKVNGVWVCTADLFNTSAQMITAINTSQTFYNILANNSLYFNGKNGDYFWNMTGGITYNNLSLANSIVKGDLANAFSINLGNISNGAVGSNWNMSIYNQSYYLSAEAVPTCSKYYNSTGTLKWCDCYNSTHKWVANSC